MKNILVALVLSLSITAHAVDTPLDIRIVPNTPLFEGSECHTYKGAEAVRASLQLIASAQIVLEVSTYSMDNESVFNLIKNKARNGVRVKLYSQNTDTLSKFNSVNVTSKLMNNSSLSPTIIKVDNAVTGMGNIYFEGVIQVKSSFYVCPSSNSNSEGLNNALEKLKIRS